MNSSMVNASRLKQKMRKKPALSQKSRKKKGKMLEKKLRQLVKSSTKRNTKYQ